MPLNTQHKRDGETVRPEGGWKEFHIAAFIYAAAFEDPELGKGTKPNAALDYPNEAQPLAPSDCFQIVNYQIIGTVFPNNKRTFVKNHKFLDTMDGTVFEIKAGDEFHCWRD